MDYIIDENLTVLMHSCERFIVETSDPSSINGLSLLAKIEKQNEWFGCEFVEMNDSSVKWANRLGILSAKRATLRKPPLFAYLECIRRSSGRRSTIVMYEKSANRFEIYLNPEVMKC
jgi:hypothetical protein